MTNRCDPADGETGHPPHDTRVGTGQVRAGQRRGTGRVDLIAAGGQEQGAAVARAEDDGFRDLVEGATDGGRGLGGGAAISELARCRLDAGLGESAGDTFQALAHGVVVPVDAGGCKG